MVPSEPLVALRTLEGFLSRVRPLVVLQHVLVPKRPGMEKNVQRFDAICRPIIRRTTETHLLHTPQVNCLSLLLAPYFPRSVPVLEGGEELDVGEGSGCSSSIFLAHFLFAAFTSTELLLETTLLLLLLLCFLALMAGDSCPPLLGGDGGELGAQAGGNSEGWKKAGFVGMARPEAAISWLAISSWDGVNMAELGNGGYGTVFRVVVSLFSTLMVSRLERMSGIDEKNAFLLRKFRGDIRLQKMLEMFSIPNPNYCI